jgi:iron complex outermembrane receptor protein
MSVVALLAAVIEANGQEIELSPMEHIIVSGHIHERFTHHQIDQEEAVLPTADVAKLMSRVPGGSMNDNGPISGQTQYRGMYGPRMNVRLDGMYVNSGGPNWMDPPLHYMPGSLLDTLEVTRGIASVSYGNGIGGHVIATYKKSNFADGSEYISNGDLEWGGHSADDAYNLGGIVSLANDTNRFHIVGSLESGNNREFPGGEITSTKYDRYFLGAGYGYQRGSHEFSVDYRFSDTDDSGTPVLPMDIKELDTDLIKGRYEGIIGAYQIIAQVNYSNVKHGMHNFVLRPAPDFSSLPLPPFVGDDRRTVDSDSMGIGYSLIVNRNLFSGFVNFGVDGHLAEHNATVGDPDVPDFFVNNFINSTTDNYGFFAEWRGDIGAGLSLELGVRYSLVKMNTDEVDAQPANLPMASIMGTPPFAVRMLRDAFNALDRTQSDNNIDWVAKLDYILSDTTNIETGVSRKVRSPSYIERYLWIPLEVNAGLGDGNNYVGDVELSPEVSHQFEFGLDWSTDSAYIAPRIYYRLIDDYIQGMPATNMFAVAVSTNASGDPNPLQFTNVNAKIYGFDAMYGLEITPNLNIDGIMSYSRGKRRDIDDELYRIAPLNTNLTLTYSRDNWGASLQGIAFARQSKISQTITANSAAGTTDPIPGYGLLNVYGHYNHDATGISIRAGIENILDKRYEDPLSGFNRVLGSDVAVGDRLPGIGRNFYATLSYHW